MIKDRANICLLAAKVTDFFSSELTKGAVEAAKDLDVNLTILPGRYIGNQDFNDKLDMHYEYQYNVLFDYAAKARFDYIIAAVGTITFPVGSDERRQFLNKFKGTPLLCVAANVEGYDCIEFDNFHGIETAVKYLADQGRKHIGIMAGLRDNYDCAERYSAYRRSLAENGLDFKESYASFGGISYECRESAEKFLNDNPDLDAVLCVNDVIASVLYEILTERGIEIGKDIAVVGFDDQPMAKELDPPLASVKADAREMGRVAVEKAVNYLKKSPDQRHFVPTQFIPRNSCFADMRFLKTPDMLFFGDNETIKSNLRSYVTMISADTGEDKAIYDSVCELMELLDKEFIQNVADKDSMERVHSEIKKLITNNRHLLINASKLYAVHESAYVWLMRCCKKENIPFVREIYGRFSSKMKKRYSSVKPKFIERTRLENTFIRDSLMFGTNLRDSYADILKRLCNIGSQTSYLYTLNNPIIHNYGFDFPDDIKWQFRSYSYGANTFSIPENEQTMNTPEVFRNSYLVSDRPRILVAAILYTAETQYGLALLEPEGDMLYDELELITYQLSSALRTLDILKDLNALLTDVSDRNYALVNESRTDELTRVYNRRGFYQAADELIEKYKGTDDTYLVCYADTENLRYINDNFGHLDGDFVIKLSSDCLRYAFGKSAFIGRMGGGEFAVIIRKSQIFSEEDIILRKDKFISDFNRSNIKTYEFNTAIGIIETQCTDREGFEDALEKACEIIIAEKQKLHSDRS